MAYYTTQTEMERLFSADGVEFHSDNENTAATNTDVVNDCIVEATDEVNLYALGRYTNAVLAANTWARAKATLIACHLLSFRRALPPRWQSRYEKIIEQLERVQQYTLNIPDANPRSETGPTVSNMVIDDLHTSRKGRVDKSTSVGPTYPGQFTTDQTNPEPY